MSAEAVHRAQWSWFGAPPKSKGTAVYWGRGKLVHVWSSPYSDGRDPLLPGRLGHGSGSTPSILRMQRALPATPTSSPGVAPLNNASFSSYDGDDPQSFMAVDSNAGASRFVIITTGTTPMRILSIRVDSGQCVGNLTVTFGQEIIQSHRGTSASSPHTAEQQQQQQDTYTEYHAFHAGRNLSTPRSPGYEQHHLGEPEQRRDEEEKPPPTALFLPPRWSRPRNNPSW